LSRKFFLQSSTQIEFLKNNLRDTRN